MKLMPWKKKEDAVVRGGEGAPPLGLFRSEVSRLLDRFFETPWSPLDEDFFASVSGWAPSFDVLDGEKDVTVRAEIPGVDPKDVEVTVSGSLLTISGEKQDSLEEKGKTMWRSERRYGSFRRSVRLPEGVDADKVMAEHGNGILTVKVAKSKTAAAKRIPVSAK